MIIVGTDFHFGARNDDEVIMKAQLDFIDNVFVPQIQKHNIKHFLNLGDTWDKRKILNIKTYNIIRERFFDVLKELDVMQYMLIGNHDIYYKNTNEVNSLSQLEKDYPNIHVVKSFEDITIGETTFGMMSWINNSNLEEAKRFIETSNANIICGHFETVGFELLPGIKAEHGLEKEWFARFDEVWSGHFHIPSKQGNFEYIGNPFDTSWSDYNQRKSVILFDENTKQKEYIHNPYRLYKVIDYSDSIDILNYDFSVLKDKFVRINVSSMEISDNSKLALFIDSVQREAYNTEVTETGQLSFVQPEDELDVQAPQDTLSKILSTVESMELAGLDKTKLKDMLTQLYSDAEEEMSK